MKTNLIHISLLAAAMTCGLQATAKPAKQGILTVPVADGTEINVYLRGDEFFHQYFTEDGYPLFEKDGYFYYGDYDADGNVIDSGIKAVDVDKRGQAARQFLAGVDKTKLEERIVRRSARSPRRANLFSDAVAEVSRHAAPEVADGNDGPPYERGYGLFPDLRFPAYGDQKAIVILVEYADVKFNANYDAKDYFTRMLNEDGFNDYGGTGCAAEYFRLNSGGAFRPEFDVYGPLTLSKNMSYYGGNSWGGDDLHPADMVKEACEQLDDVVDFSEYDRNGDGVVDNIFIFYAGRGEASGGSSDTVWPHSWNMVSAGYPDLYYDGVRVHTYGCSNEWENGRPDGVGTFIHEFSHVMGLPDLYATSYTGSFTPGAWSALDYGPYNNDGMTPPNYGAFERYALGWMKPNEIDAPLSATLPSVDNNVAGIIRTEKETEFFLVENRQKTGWDTYIPGHGMLIWHVDYDNDVWKRNVVNNTPSHQYVDIEEADGSQSEYSRGGDSFPGTAGKTSFTALTRPALKTWSNKAIDLPLTDIAETDGLITFDVLGGAPVPDMPDVAALQAEDVTPQSFVARWVGVAGYDHILSVFSYDENNNPVYVNGFCGRNVGDRDSFTVTGLEPECQYFYTVMTSTGWFSGLESDAVPVTTGRFTIEYYTSVATDATEVEADGFTANWLPTEEAVDYLLTVYVKVPGDPLYDVCDFTGGLDNLGDWTTTSGMTYGMESYSGEAVPALRLNADNTLTSPEYGDFVKDLTFWHRGSNTSADDMIYVYAVTPQDVVLVEKIEVDTNVGGVESHVEGFPENTVRIRLQFVRGGESGSVAVDDVKVGHGHEYYNEILEGYEDLKVGDVLAYSVTGLQPSTDYVYTIRATDGSLFSRRSEEVNVRTKGSSGVDVPMMADFAVECEGYEVSATTGDELYVSDCSGVVVARGSSRVTLPGAGLYIVNVPARNYVRKIIVR